MFETQRELRQAERALRAKGATAITTGLRSQDSKAKDAPPGSFVAEVIGVLKSSNAPEKLQDDVWQLFLKAMPDMSMRKRQIHRRNIAGFDSDALRAFAKNGFHAGHQLARLRHSHILQDDLESQEKQLGQRRNHGELTTAESTAADALLHEIKRRHEFIMNPQDSAVANQLTGFGFAFYLGLTPAAALVNLTQGAQATFPVLGAKYGWGRASAALAKSTGASLRGFGATSQASLTEEERMAYQAMREAGWIEKTQVHSLAGLAEGAQLQQSPGYQRVMNTIGFLFQRMEMVNREAAGMAAFRLARAGGEGVKPMTFTQAVQYAGDIINGTHFDYSNANRPRYMQGNVAKVLLQFRNYSVGMTWLFWRGVQQAFAGATPEVKRLARRQTAGMLGMTGLLAGTLGMPIINVIRYTAEAIEAAFGDDDEPWDFNVELRGYLDSVVGATAADVILRGPVSQATGADIASRVGLADLWWREPDRELEGQELYAYALEQLAGPMGGIGKSTLEGLQKVGEGHVWRGVEQMLPKAVKDVLKGWRYHADGATSLRGDPIMEDISARQALTQAMGFSPTALSRQYELNRAAKNYEQHILDRRASIINAFALGVREQDQELLAAARLRIGEWNRKYPEMPITLAGLRTSLRARARYSAQAESGIVLNQRLAGRVREAIGAP